MLLYGCESWCLTAESVSRLRNWHNKRIREMCRVTMCQSFVHQISAVSLQKRMGVFSIEYCLASRTTLGWSRRTHAQEPATKKAHAFVGTRTEDSERSRDDLWKIYRTASEVLRPRWHRSQCCGQKCTRVRCAQVKIVVGMASWCYGLVEIVTLRGILLKTSF